VLALLGGTVGYGISQQIKPTYEATVTLLVGDLTQTSNLTKDAIDSSVELASTYSALIRSAPVLERATQELGQPTQSWVDLKNRVHVDVSNGSPLLTITVFDRSPQQAISTATAVVHGALALSPAGPGDQRVRGLRAFAWQRASRLQDNITEAQKQISQLRSSLSSSSISSSNTGIRSLIDRKERLIIAWQANYAALIGFLSTEAAPNRLKVLQPAQASLTPVRPDTKVNTALGIAIGIAIAFAIDYALAFRRGSRPTTDGGSRGPWIPTHGQPPTRSQPGLGDRMGTPDPWVPTRDPAIDPGFGE
jgi:capsular polysaccharide biosynthesis protein